MNARTKPIADTILGGVSERLRAPLPRKTRFLRELSDDLEALTARFVADGLPTREARARAVEALVPDDATLARLDRLHASWYARVTGPLDGERLRRAERAALVACFALLLVVEARAVLAGGFVQYRSPFLWPVLMAGSLVVLAVAAKAFEFWIKRDHSAPRFGLRGLLGLSAAPLVVAACGTWFDVITLAGRLQQSPELADPLLLRTLIEEASMLSIALLFALFGGLGWLILNQWLAVHEHACQRALFQSFPIPEEE